MKIIKICILASSLILAMYAKSEVSLSDKQIGLRKTDLLNESFKIQDINYKEEPAGLSTKIERSFENAPPLIPHDVTGLVPITKDYVSCLDCHLPSVAAEVQATPIPKTHFINFRTGKDLNGLLSDERYNCTQCHVTQADAKPLVGNNFKPEFRNEESKTKANLIDVLNEGIK